MAWDSNGNWHATEEEARAADEARHRREASAGPGPAPRRSDYDSDADFRRATELHRRQAEERGADGERFAEEDAAARAAEEARWDAMSWEERAEARARGERPPSEGGGGGGGSGGYPGGEGMSDFDSVSADIPIWGDITGARARQAREAGERARAERMGYIGDLAEFMPGEDELSVEYGNEDMIGPGGDSLLARDAFAEWSEGGFTDADRAMMDEARRRSGMAARASREADLSALEARGMGGSGASLAAMLSAGEGAADRNASTDATMMGAAQDRQYRATTALGEFGAREDDYARRREGRNTDRENRTRESAAEAAQQAHENRSEWTSFATGGDPNARNANEEEDESDEAAGGFVEGILSLFD